MCCPDRKTPVNIIFLMSIFGVIASIAMIIFSFLMVDQDVFKQLEQDKDLDDIEDGKQLVFLALLIFSITVLLISAFGFCLKCIQNRCVVCTYGILLLPIWIVVLIFGIVALVIAGASNELIEDECKNFQCNYSNGSIVCDDENDSANNIMAKQIKAAEDALANGQPVEEPSWEDVVISLDIYESIYINTDMCSSNCPCTPGDHSKDWTFADFDATNTDATEDNLLFSRTKPFDFTGTFKNYNDCVQNTKNGKETYQDGIWFSFANEFRQQTDFDSIGSWIEFFEREYECAGICTPALFSWFNDVSAGRPQGSCINKIKDEITASFMGLAISAIIAGLLLFCTFICQYCLWRSYDDDE